MIVFFTNQAKFIFVLILLENITFVIEAILSIFCKLRIVFKASCLRQVIIKVSAWITSVRIQVIWFVSNAITAVVGKEEIVSVEIDELAGFVAVKTGYVILTVVLPIVAELKVRLIFIFIVLAFPIIPFYEWNYFVQLLAITYQFV